MCGRLAAQDFGYAQTIYLYSKIHEYIEKWAIEPHELMAQNLEHARTGYSQISR